MHRVIDQKKFKQMLQFLARRLAVEDKPVALRRLLSHTRSERALVAMFLALLELVRLRAVLLRQMDLFAPITVAKSRRFEEILANKNAEEFAADLDESIA